MKVLVIGTYLNHSLIEKYNNISKSNSKISVAAVKYSKLISKGFSFNLGEDSEHLFMAPIGAYPNCKKLFWWQENIDGVKYIRFINIILLKQLTVICFLFWYLLKWSINNRREKKVVVFTFIYLPFLFSIIPFKIFSKINFVSFVPDLPSYEFSYSENDGILKRKLIPVYISLSNKMIGLLDYFIFITKYMKNVFPNRPYTVIEGLVDINEENHVEMGKIENKKAVMYAGALFEKFGISTLLDAFSQIDGDFELWFFGTGDAVSEIQKKATQDTRIKYFGSLPNEQILNFQKKALLLINPRFSSEEFTKYSFPSKLMEYLASGTPTLTTRLPGIPDDYNDKFYFIGDESVEGFKFALENCLNKDNEELRNFGNRGKDFVNSEKNYKKQIKYVIMQLNNFILK